MEWIKAISKKISNCSKDSQYPTNPTIEAEQIMTGIKNHKDLFMTWYCFVSSCRTGNFKCRMILLKKRITNAVRWKGPAATASVLEKYKNTKNEYFWSKSSGTYATSSVPVRNLFKTPGLGF